MMMYKCEGEKVGEEVICGIHLQWRVDFVCVEVNRVVVRDEIACCLDFV